MDGLSRLLKNKMKNQTIKLNDLIIEYSLKGEGNPSIVFINGFRMPLDSWNRLYPGVEKLGRVFTYNRPGIGNSSKAMSDQTGTTVVETLRSLLKVVGLPSPYVLVGHSLGGIFANLYTRMYPEEVSGIVLVEAAHPDEPKKQKEIQKTNLVMAINNGHSAGKQSPRQPTRSPKGHNATVGRDDQILCSKHMRSLSGFSFEFSSAH
jgi:pimeloyl-ACP methyl ester carboxylesterase